MIGRSDDMVVVRGLNMFPTMVAAVVTSFKEMSGDYRIVLIAPAYDDVASYTQSWPKEFRTTITHCRCV